MCDIKRRPKIVRRTLEVAMKCVVVILFFVQIFAHILGNAIPSDWKTCKQNDPNMNNCLKDAVATALGTLMTGNQKFGIRALDPLHVDNATMLLDSSDAKAKITFIDNDILNFIKNSRVESVESDWKTMTVKIVIPEGFYATTHCHIPQGSTFMGQPVFGDGLCDYHYGESTTTWRLKFGEKLINDVTYYNVEDFKFQIDTDKITYKLKNLYNGDSVKTEKMEKLMNDNWKLLWEPLRLGVNHVLSQTGLLSSNRVFNAVPKIEVTPP